jgi:hypothetical protein
MAYAAALGNARFAPVPGGNSPETIRLYDVLEMGCIPIMRRSAWVAQPRALGGVPFPLIDSWSDLAGVYAPFASDDVEAHAALDALQAEVISWWTGFKRTQQQRLRTLVDTVFGDTA